MKKKIYVLIPVLLLFINNVFSQINSETDNLSKDETLVIVNDSILKYEAIQDLKHENIETVIVLKDEKAISLYGEKAKNGVIIITTKNISKRKLKKFYKKHNFKNVKVNENQEFIISGFVIDCEQNPIPGVTIQNINSKIITQTDFEGEFSIKVNVNDIVEISSFQYNSQKITIEKDEKIIIHLKLKNEHQILVEKPVIYLYPKTEIAIDLQINFKGKMLTSFPKYEDEWKVIAQPNGQIFDTKTKRYYNSLFWDGTIDFSSEHYQYKDGFVVAKENLTHFFIEKLEHIGLNNQETNDFIQFWLPILEQNSYNFIHFIIHENCNEIATLNINPKPETSLRIYMEFYGLKNVIPVIEQQLPKTERKGFTLVEWGGSDVSSKMKLKNL